MLDRIAVQDKQTREMHMFVGLDKLSLVQVRNLILSMRKKGHRRVRLVAQACSLAYSNEQGHNQIHLIG